MKKVMDFCLSLILLIIFFPIIIIISGVIKVTSGGPVFFLQNRIGLKQKPFKIIKFRTMKQRFHVINQKNEEVLYENTDDRLSKIGSILRSLSLDELPQLINVLKGDMSIVGPRPVVFEQLDAIPKRFMRRFDVKPGITGLSQIKGRRNLGWIEQLEYDVKYVDSYSFLLDFSIMIKTPAKVLKKEGVYSKQNQDNWRNYL